jgi:hypothetical protein
MPAQEGVRLAGTSDKAGRRAADYLLGYQFFEPNEFQRRGRHRINLLEDILHAL